MFRLSIVTVAAGLAVLLGSTAGAEKLDLWGPADNAAERRVVNPCSTHARVMRNACYADRHDGYLVHVADCIYVTSAEDQRECIADARDERIEAGEECEAIHEGRLEVCDLVGEARFDVEFDPAGFVDPDEIGVSIDPNPYWPLTAGHTHVILGEGEVTVLTATDEVRDIGGLPCRVLRDLVFEESTNERGDGVEYDAIEVTQDWYAQTLKGDTVYCGENTYEIEDGLIDNTDGSFANGTNRARAGFLVRAFPVVGEGDRQEMASDEAEDYVRYESLGATPSDDEGGDSANFPCNDTCLQTFEVNPRDPAQAEFKYYLPGTGFVLATKLEDGEFTGEREEVSCVGDSIDVLNDPACGIADPAALFDELCAWAPEALCFDDE